MTRSSRATCVAGLKEPSIHPQGGEGPTPGCSGQAWPLGGSLAAWGSPEERGSWNRVQGTGLGMADPGDTSQSAFLGQRSQACGPEEYEVWDRWPQTVNSEHCPSGAVPSGLGAGVRGEEVGAEVTILERLQEVVSEVSS